MSLATALKCAPVAAVLLASAAIVVGPAPATGEIPFFVEDFCDVSDWSGWQATITTDGDIGTVTADVDYGKVEMANWTVAEFGCGAHTDSLFVVCTDVSGHFIVKIMEEVPPFEEITLIDGGYNTPGTYAADVRDITGWAGQKSFKLVVWVEWATPGWAKFDEIRLVNTSGWADDFEPIQVGWRDDNTNPGFNATIADISGPYAIVQELPGVDWGKVLSPVLTINLDDAPTLTAVVQSDAEMSNFLFGIQEEEGAYRFFELGRGYEAGIFVYDVRGITGLMGVHTFSIQVGVESQDVDGWVVLDSVKLDCSEAPPVETESMSWGKVKKEFFK
jgi:hypothetical protein